MSNGKVWLTRIGTGVVIVGMVALSGLVWWNRCGAGPYRDTCTHAIGCRSYLCLKHRLDGSGSQIAGPGHCTKSCTSDGDCAGGDSCVVLGDAAREDLPPYGKPTRACMAK